MPMLLAALLVLSGDVEHFVCSLSVLVIGFNLLGFGLGLTGKVDDSSFVRMSGGFGICSVDFLL